MLTGSNVQRTSDAEAELLHYLRVRPLGSEGKAFKPHDFPALLLHTQLWIGDNPLDGALQPLWLSR